MKSQLRSQNKKEHTEQMLPKQMEQNILKSVVGENAQQVKEKKENEVVTTFTTSNFLILNEQNQNTTSKCLETPDS